VEEVVTILAVGEVVAGEVGAGHDDLVVDAVELHVLETPAFVDAFGNVFLAQACEVGRVVHTDFDALGSELGDQRGE
jgi:hypothetical protein